MTLPIPSTKSRLHLGDAAGAPNHSTLEVIVSVRGTARQQSRPPAPWPCIAPSSERWHAHHAWQKSSGLRLGHSRVLAESAYETECPRSCHPADTAIWCLCRCGVVRWELHTIRPGHRTVLRPDHL